MNRYFYIDNEGKQKGTFSPEELKAEHIKKDTLVWTQGMNEWKPAENVAELSFLFEGTAGYYPAENVTYPSPPDLSPTTGVPNQPPKTWLIESILVTVLPFLLCSSIFSLLGIIAIVNASKVESLFLRKDYSGAQEASQQAGKWTKITLWITVGWIALWIIAIIGLLVFAGSLAGISDMLSGSVYDI